MSSYQRILAQFQKLGFYEDSSLQQSQVNRALDTLANQNAGFRQFDHDIAEEIWEHTSKDTPRTVKLRDLVSTIQQADNILRDQMAMIRGQLQGQNDPSRRNHLKQQINDIINDHKQLSAPFKFSPLAQSQILEQSQGNRTQILDLDRGNGSRVSSNNHQSAIFGYESNQREGSSTDLKIVILLALLWLLWEFIVMFQKHHFLNLLACFSVISIYALNYFDRKYIQFVLGFVALSCIFDLVWMIVHASDYWNTSTTQTQHSTLHSAFLVFIVVMTALLIVLKILIVAILFKYRLNSQTIRKNVSIFGYRIKLDGKPTYNPFTPILGGANDYF